ncbi:MAG TPA: CHAD domain-containing protein, partial [Puia sp.]
MLTRNHQRKYIDKIKKEAASQLKKMAAPSSPEDLHRFRVSLKKLKSFGDYLSASKDKSIFKPLKKLFKRSGKLRDLHNADLIEEDHFIISPVTKNKRKQKFNDACRQFASDAADHQKCLAKTGKHLLKKIKGVSFDSIQNYFSKEIAAIPAYLSKNNDDAIHSGRKRLKILMYLYRMLSTSLQKKLNIQIDYLDQL